MSDHRVIPRGPAPAHRGLPGFLPKAIVVLGILMTSWVAWRVMTRGRRQLSASMAAAAATEPAPPPPLEQPPSPFTLQRYHVLQPLPDKHNSGDEVARNPLASPEATAVFEEIIDEINPRFHIHYRGYFANHLSQGSVALYRLGATAARLKQFAREYCERLEPAHPRAEDEDALSNQHPLIRQQEQQELLPITLDNWKAHRGRQQFFIPLVDFFRQEITCAEVKEGISRPAAVRAAVARWAPQLSVGWSGSALHPLIQLGWGLDVGREQMIVEGLAWCVFSYVEAGVLRETPPPVLGDNRFRLSVPQMLGRIHDRFGDGAEIKLRMEEFADANPGRVDASSPFTRKVTAIMGIFGPQLQDIVTNFLDLGLEPQPPFQWHPQQQQQQHPPGQQQGHLYRFADLQATVDVITQTVDLMYARSRQSFFMLHGVTAWWGARNVLAAIDNPQDQAWIIRNFLVQFAAVWMSLEFPGAQDPVVRELVSSDSPTSQPVLEEAAHRALMQWWDEMPDPDQELPSDATTTSTTTTTTNSTGIAAWRRPQRLLWPWKDIIRLVDEESLESEHAMKLAYVLSSDALRFRESYPELDVAFRVAAIDKLQTELLDQEEEE